MAWKGEEESEERARFSAGALDHLDHLYRVAFHLARETHEAHDLVQETYVRALDCYEQFNPGTNMKAWLTRILYNFFLDNYKQGKRWIPLDGKNPGDEEGPDYWERMAADDPGPEGHLLSKELTIKINEALGRIPEEFRVTIVLVDMGELSYAEAAEVLSCPVGTVRSRLSRGRRHLHRELKGYYIPEVEPRLKRAK